MENNKKHILIISPQRWGDMRISKHHYAISFLDLGYHVSFLSPPNKNSQEINIKETKEGLKVIDFGMNKIAARLKNKISLIYKYHITSIFLKIEASLPYIDLVINFDNGIFYRNDYEPFKHKTIFFPVDQLIDKNIDVENSKMICSISQQILDSLKTNKVKLLLNHGLSPEFENMAKQNQNKGAHRKNDKINIGYIGNLLIDSLNHQLLLKLIMKYPKIKFHFWGNYDLGVKGLGKGQNIKEIKIFIDCLKATPNVKLYGIASPLEISHILSEMDINLLCYKEKKHYKLDNSHKVLEYLATGKAVVSSILSEYSKNDKVGLINTPDNNTDDSYLRIFDKTIQNIDLENSKFNQIRRINFALKNTYKQHTETILKKFNYLKTLN